MRLHTLGLVIASLATGVVVTACAGGGGAASVRPGTAVVPGSIGSAPAPLGGGAIRRTSAITTCSGVGTGSFNGVSANSNVTGGTESVVAGGAHNMACDAYAAITGGYYNIISGTRNGAAESFIGGGETNEISAAATYSVIIGGYGNSVDPTNGNSVEPIATWSYVSERGVRHVGPMAQDFYAAFGVGADDRHITSIDEDGVALAAIKALHVQTATLHAENSALRAQFRTQLRAQQREIDELRTIVRSMVRP